jgi:hypothetical protein
MSKFTPANCPHCEYDRRFPGFESGGWMQQDNNGPIVSCPVCNDDGLHLQRPIEVLHQQRNRIGNMAVNHTFGRVR